MRRYLWAVTFAVVALRTAGWTLAIMCVAAFSAVVSRDAPPPPGSTLLAIALLSFCIVSLLFWADDLNDFRRRIVSSQATAAEDL